MMTSAMPSSAATSRRRRIIRRPGERRGWSMSMSFPDCEGYRKRRQRATAFLKKRDQRRDSGGERPLMLRSKRVDHREPYLPVRVVGRLDIRGRAAVHGVDREPHAIGQRTFGARFGDGDRMLI